ncbi:major facilitator superfamily domain-containing protein [Mycena albidolilacea]|uniref:Major facilitator superfamily domain-containing protein n=1 Tax=Mycena albidolilacea TaxID=1033008 RepID=A0AAD7E8Q7_9AGAR|nr:major facilitator superfamily domain-containing protein [Mycena albidolilacea]
MGHDLIRDSTIGQVINHVSSGRILPYADQRPSYVVPTCLLAASASPEKTKYDKNRSAERLDITGTTPSPTDLERQSTGLTLGCDISDPYLIDWEENDPDNPQNWSLNKRAFVAFEISFLTFSVYIGSAIYVSSIPGLMQEFHVSLTTATLGLTLYILAYGIGAMFLTPLQELHLLGRNPVYMVTLFLFVIFQISTITAKNINTVLAMRFMTGLSGSPALATGGASMADIFPSSQQPYVIGIWAFGGIAGPIIGPIIGGFAAQAESWRWPILELLWISGFSLAFLGLLLPETHGPTILLRRAKRLRALTGNHELRTATNEIDGGKLVYDALVLPLVLSIEPVLLFANIYLGFIYAVFYLWFEAFSLVFGDIYHFNEGLSGLPFLGFLVSGVFTYTVYCLYQMYHIAPRYARAAAANKEVPPEIKLEIGLIASIFIPTSVLIFGFASKPSIHWIVPVIGAALYLPGLYLIFQSILMYITTAYPDHGAPVLASNTLFRAAIASVFPLFGRAFFRNLGLGPGSAVLAGISFFLMAVYWFLLRYAHILRRRSKYALST